MGTPNRTDKTKDKELQKNNMRRLYYEEESLQT